MAQATSVILAVPDDAIASVASVVSEVVRPGCLLVVLDAAAAYAGRLPRREGLGTFVTHPCHPSVFSVADGASEARDYFGGVTPQSIVNCLVSGRPEDYDRGEWLAAYMWSPVTKSYRVSLDQMVLLEPVLSEVVALACVAIVKEALDEVVKRGVPKEIAREFVAGHLNLDLAAVGEIDDTLSTSAHRMLAAGKAALLRPSWKQVFEPATITGFVDEILRAESR